MTGFISMLIAALYAMLFQNLVFTAAYGVCESIKIAKRPKHFLMCAVSVAFFSTVTPVCCYYIQTLGFMKNVKLVYYYALYVLVLAVVYIISALFCVGILKADKKFMNSLGMCAFNSLVLCVPILNFKAGHTLWQCVGTGIGSALAFVLSVILINAGIRHIASSKKIPAVFRGTPVLIIYIALLSLALSCFSGESLFI